MGPFLPKRLATLLITLAVASAVVFAVLELLPGNAAEVILGDTATPESLAALQAKLGLDRPPLTRYADWVAGLLRGVTGIVTGGGRVRYTIALSNDTFHEIGEFLRPGAPPIRTIEMTLKRK